MRWIAIAVALSVATPYVVPVLAQASSASAEAQVKKGRDHFHQKSYSDALAAFSAAYDASPTAHAAYWAGRAAEELHQSAVAAQWYEKAIAAGKPAAGEDAKGRLEALKKEPVTVVFESNPDGATIRVDGKEFAQKTPFFAHLPPGSHQVVAEIAGKSVSRTVDLAPYSKTTVKLDIDDTAPAPKKEPPPKAEPPEAPPKPAAATITPEAPPPARPASGVKPIVYVTAGGAIVALGLGTVFGLNALSHSRAYRDDPTPERESAGRTSALVSDVLFVVGLGLAVTSAVLYVGGRRDGVAIAPVASPTFAGGALSLRF